MLKSKHILLTIISFLLLSNNNSYSIDIHAKTFLRNPLIFNGSGAGERVSKALALASGHSYGPERMIADSRMGYYSSRAISAIVHTQFEGKAPVIYDEVAIGALPTEELARQTRGARVFGIGNEMPSYKILHKEDGEIFFDKHDNLLYVITPERKVLKVDSIDPQVKSEFEILASGLKAQTEGKSWFTDSEGNTMRSKLDEGNLLFIEANIFAMEKARKENDMPPADIVRIANNFYTIQDIEMVLKSLLGSVNDNGYVLIGREHDPLIDQEEYLVYRKRGSHFVLENVMLSAQVGDGKLGFGLSTTHPSIGSKLTDHLLAILKNEELKRFIEEGVRDLKWDRDAFNRAAHAWELEVVSIVAKDLSKNGVEAEALGPMIMLGENARFLPELADMDLSKLGFSKYREQLAKRNNTGSVQLSEIVGGNKQVGKLEAALFNDEAWIDAGGYTYKAWVEKGALYLQPYSSDRTVPLGDILKASSRQEPLLVSAEAENGEGGKTRVHFSVRSKAGLNYSSIVVEDFGTESGTRVEWLGRKDWVTQQDKEPPQVSSEEFRQGWVKREKVDLMNLPAGSLVYLQVPSENWLIRVENGGMISFWRKDYTGCYYGHAELLGDSGVFSIYDYIALPRFTRGFTTGALEDYNAEEPKKQAFPFFQVRVNPSTQPSNLADVINQRHIAAVCP